MKKVLFLLPLFLFADVNPFNAGLNSSNPYGLTTDEKYILENKKNINKLQEKLDQVQKTINQIKLKLANYDEVINDKLSAFPTIIDEVNTAMKDISFLKREINTTKTQMEVLNEKIIVLNNKITSLENNISTIKLSIKEIIKTQNDNFQILKNTINKLLKKIENMNKTLSPKKAFIDARKAFFANKLDKAKEGFLYSLSKKYLPATSSYYLGEIAFKKKNYKEALAFYKKSVNLYPKKTSYMPRLLYHTAISFEKLGNKKAAKLTLQKLINDFPKSKYSNLAKKELEKLK